MALIFVVVLGAILGALHYLLYRRYVRAVELPRVAQWFAVAVLATGFLLSLVGLASGRVFDPSDVRLPAYVGLMWLAVVFYLVLGLAVLGLVLLGCRIARVTDVRRRVVVRVGSAIVVVASLGTVAYGAMMARDPQVVEVTAEVADLPPELAGLRIALISDLHVGPALDRSFTEKVVDKVNAAEPDLIVLTGDLTDGTVDAVGADLAPIAELRAPLGTFAVTGNHEYYFDDVDSWIAEWSSRGITTLRNDSVLIGDGPARLWIAGVHDYRAPEPEPNDLEAAVSKLDRGDFTILLAHQPIQAPEAAELGVDLQLSGHTHGGQIWPFHYAVMLTVPTDIHGLDRVGEMTVYTTTGAGAWGPPVRIGAAPEIPIITLQPR